MARARQASLQPRSRRESVFLFGILLIAVFFLYRIVQFKGVGQRGSTISLVTTQIVQQGRKDGDPASVVTQIVIGSHSNGGSTRFSQDSGISNGGQGQKSSKTLGVTSSNSVGGEDRVQAVDRKRAVANGGKLSVDSKSGDSWKSDKVNPQKQSTSAQDESFSKSKAKPAVIQATPAATPDPKWGPNMPRDFDWQTYLLYHPELRDEGVVSDSTAREHYLRKGRGEGYIFRRLRVILRYTACTGLINQHYSHIAAFSLCAVLGAELVLPPAVKRDSFAHYFSVFAEQNEVKWTSDDLDSLLHVEKIIEFWKNRGLTVHRTPSLTPFPDLTRPDVAFPLYNAPDIDPELIVRMGDVYLRNLDMPELIEMARLSVIGHAMTVMKANPDKQMDYIVLDLPCTFFMLRSLSNLRVVTEVAKSLEFSPRLWALADKVIRGMTDNGRNEYNAVHLRIEKDARDWSAIMGGQEVVWHGYVQSMQQAGFTENLVLYTASGLLTYGATSELSNIVKTLKEFGLCSEVHYKEMYLEKEELEGLNSEQKALVDFLVLSRGRGFVGFGSSTFSFYLREYRVLNGIPRSSSVLVDASVIGTDPLFNSAGTVI